MSTSHSEGNSSDSSLKDDRSQSTDKKKKQKSKFSNGLLGSLKLGKSKKHKQIEKDSPKV